MATAFHLVGLSSSVPGALDLTMEFDRVLAHRGGPPAPRFPAGTPGPRGRSWRRGIEASSRRRGRETRADSSTSSMQTGHDAVVLGMADSVAWFTSGGDLGQDLCSGSGRSSCSSTATAAR